MSQLPPYNRAFSFSNFQDANPSAPIAGSQVDLELGNAKATFDRTNMALIQRGDGALANGSVTFDTLSSALQTAGLAPALPWATNAAYSVSASVTHGSAFYRCLVAHTSALFRHGSRGRQMGTNRRFFHDGASRRALDRGNASRSLTTDVQNSLQASTPAKLRHRTPRIFGGIE